jgi:hypothetical protein
MILTRIIMRRVNGKRYQQRGRNLELDTLRIEMIRRGLTYRDLAALVKTQPQRIANILSGSDRTWPLRARINRLLRKRIFAKPANTRGRVEGTTK